MHEPCTMPQNERLSGISFNVTALPFGEFIAEEVKVVRCNKIVQNAIK